MKTSMKTENDQKKTIRERIQGGGKSALLPFNSPFGKKGHPNQYMMNNNGNPMRKLKCNVEDQ